MNYDELGPFPVTKDELKKRYYHLSKKYHPDAGGTNEEFNRLAELYETLLKNINNTTLFVLTEKEKKEIPICRECNGQGVDYDYFKGTLVKTWRCDLCKGTGFSSFNNWRKWAHELGVKFK